MMSFCRGRKMLISSVVKQTDISTFIWSLLASENFSKVFES